MPAPATAPEPEYNKTDRNREHPRWYFLAHNHPTKGHFRAGGLAQTFATHEEEYAAYEEWAREYIQPGQVYEILPRSTHTEHERQNLGGMYFYNAWVHEPGSDAKKIGGAVLNMPFARAIFRHHIRQVRDPLLNALDVEYYKAQETGADTTDIVARKQALRDLPQDPRIEAATNANELFAAWPTELLGERSTEGRGLPAQGYYESPGTY